jgi:methyltransferase (TIGR00027 family)
MHEQEPSRTALAAAAHRAAHQILDAGRVFADPLAVTILAGHAEAIVRDAEARPSSRGMRLFIAARSRLAEAALADGVEQRGVRQLVVLGAGLDTFAYRNPFADRLRVFEVDHPATQAWKKRRLAEAGIIAPPSLVFAPIDFERENLSDALLAAGLRPDVRTLFVWLGVVPYLTTDAISATLGLIGGWPGGGEVVFDYSDPPETLSEDARALHLQRAQAVATAGEPFLSHFDPPVLHAELKALGFERIDDLGPRALVERHIWPGVVTDAGRPDRGGHVLFAATPSGG